MDITAILLLVTLPISGILGVLLYLSRQEIADLKHTRDAALDASERADQRREELVQFHKDMIGRPVQAVIGPREVEALGKMLIDFLVGPFQGHMEVPVYPQNPRKPEDKQ